MKLSSASKYLSAAGICGDSRSIDERHASRGRGIPQHARALKTHDSDSYDTFTEKPMPMDEDGLQRQGYAYKGETPWSVPPTKDSDPTVLYAMPTDNDAPQIRQFSGTINWAFSSEKISAAKSKFPSYSSVSWFLRNRPMELFASTLLMVALGVLRTPATSLLQRKEWNSITGTALLLMVSGRK
jgi:hypothetical protein